MQVPLAQHEILDTRCVETARQVVGSIYCDHELLPMRSGAPRSGFHAVHNHVPVNKLSLNYVKYSQRVKLDPGCTESFFMLQLPLEGGADVDICGNRFVSDTRTGYLISPTEEVTMVWSEDCAALMVPIQRSAVEQELGRLIQNEVTKPLVFEPVMSLEDNPRAASWWRFVQCMLCDIDCGTFASLGEAEKSSVESMLITNLLHAVPHNYSMLLQSSGSGIAPRQVKVAEAYMLENIRETVTITDLVDATGVSDRALYDAFKRFRGVTPMKRFSQLRMQQVRIDLQAAGREDTVTDVLTRCGISQMGRFAAQYRQAYGETPSETLKR